MNKPIAEQIRALLLDVSFEDRRDVLRQTGLCLHCFDDLRQPDGTERKCWCMRDE